MTTRPTVARVLATTLADRGVTRAFGIPGGGTSPLVAELERAGIEFVLTHGETSAVLMASTEGERTGIPGVALTSLGPGAAAAVNGVAHARLDRVPLLVVTDRLPAVAAREGYHQWIDHTALYAPITKASVTLGPDRTRDAVLHAIATATSGTPGAVHLDVSKADAESEAAPGPARPLATVDRAGTVPRRVRELVAAATHPVLVVGLGARRVTAGRVAEVAARLRAPVLTTYKGKGAIDETTPWSAGIVTGGAPERALLDRADLVVTVGFDETELITSMAQLDAPRIALEGYDPPPGVLAPPTHQLIGALDELLDELVPEPGSSAWEDGEVAAFRADVERRMGETSASGDGLHPWTIAATVDAECSVDAEITVDAGAHMLPVAQAWRSRRPGEFWISNGLATMGYGLPAAIARSAADPDRPVVCCTGDGGLLMVAGELATAARVAHRLVIVVFDDAALSLIRIKQVGEQVGRGVDFRGPAWPEVASGFGLATWPVEDEPGLREALREARTLARPSLIVARTDASPYGRMLATLRG